MTDLGNHIRTVVESAYPQLPAGVVDFAVHVEGSAASVRAVHETGATQTAAFPDGSTDDQIISAIVDLFADLAAQVEQNALTIGWVGMLANPPSRPWTTDD